MKTAGPSAIRIRHSRTVIGTSGVRPHDDRAVYRLHLASEPTVPACRLTPPHPQLRPKDQAPRWPAAYADICKIWTSEAARSILNTIRQMPGLHSLRYPIPRRSDSARIFRPLHRPDKKSLYFNRVMFCSKTGQYYETVTIAGRGAVVRPVLHRVIHRFRGKLGSCIPGAPLAAGEGIVLSRRTDQSAVESPQQSPIFGMNRLAPCIHPPQLAAKEP